MTLALRTAAVASLCIALATPAFAAGAPGEENPACGSESPGGDFVQFSCPLPVHGNYVTGRFQADFAGGHDDTSASMTVTLDGQAFECGPGSKTHLFGEDGNVGIVCKFRVRTTPGAQPVLAVALLWSHAQYVRTALVLENAGR